MLLLSRHVLVVGSHLAHLHLMLLLLVHAHILRGSHRLLLVVLIHDVLLLVVVGWWWLTMLGGEHLMICRFIL